MNALAAIAPSPAGMIANGLLPSPLRAASAASASNTPLPVDGFVDLINALLGSGVKNEASEPNAHLDEFTGGEIASGADAPAASQNLAQTGVLVASNANLAQALIRSMLGGRTASLDDASLSSDAKSAKPKSATLKSLAKPAQPVAREARVTTPVELPFEIALQTISGDSALSDGGSDVSDGGSGASGGANQAGSGIAQPIDFAKSQASQAPLAFSAKLTPLDEDQAGSEAQPGAPDPASLIDASAPPTSDAGMIGKPALSSAPASHAELSGDSREDSTPRVAATASPGDLAHAFENGAQPGAGQFASNPPADGAKSASTFGTVADTLRSSESRFAEPASSASAGAPGASPVQEIAMRITRPEMPSVDLRVTERGGEIHVDVRTPDAGLETALREDLGTLTSSLERAGYRAETFVPLEGASASGTAALKSAPSSNMNSNDDRQQQESGSSGRQSGDSAEHRQQQRQRNSRVQDWINEMEKQQ